MLVPGAALASGGPAGRVHAAPALLAARHSATTQPVVALAPGDAEGGAAASDEQRAGPAEALELFLEGSFDLESGNPGRAIPNLRAAARLDSTAADLLLVLARAYDMAGMADSCAIRAAAAHRHSERNAPAAMLCSACWVKAGRMDRALAWAKTATADDPKDPEALGLLLRALGAEGRNAEALEILSGPLDPAVQTDAIRMHRALLLGQAGRDSAAVAELAVVLARDPGHPHAEAWLSRILAEMADRSAVIPLLDSLLTRRPDLRFVREALIRALAETSDLEGAAKHLRYLSDADPADPMVQLRLGVLLFMSGAKTEAERHLRNAVAIQPREAEPYRWLWRIAYQDGRAGDALEFVTKLLTLAPGDRDGRFWHALTMQMAGRLDDARMLAESLATEHPEDVQASLLAAGISSELGDTEAALQRIRALLERRPQDREARLQLAQTFLQAGMVDSSLAVQDGLLADYPDDPRVLNDAGYTCLEHGLRPTQALEWVRRAAELEPNNPAYLDSYGWGLFLNGDAASGIEYLERAVELDPRQVVILEHLGRALESTGRGAEAEAVFRRALELAPGNRELEDLIRSVCREGPDRDPVR